MNKGCTAGHTTAQVKACIQSIYEGVNRPVFRMKKGDCPACACAWTVMGRLPLQVMPTGLGKLVRR